LIFGKILQIGVKVNYFFYEEGSGDCKDKIDIPKMQRVPIDSGLVTRQGLPHHQTFGLAAGFHVRFHLHGISFESWG
jgi:hypothetical protein